MANPFHSEFSQKSSHGLRESTKTGSSPFKEKPGFPSADLPGKTQPKDRSNSIKRLKAHPKTMGL